MKKTKTKFSQVLLWLLCFAVPLSIAANNHPTTKNSSSEGPALSEAATQSNCNTEIAYWSLDACYSTSSNNSSQDYSELTAITNTPANSGGNVTATNLFRNQGSHSCTPGVNGSTAVCVGTRSSCNFLDNDSYALRFEITLRPASGGSSTLSALQFFEQAPNNYDWENGATGPNNFPTRYGIRVTKNGQEIFKSTNKSTTRSWTLESFDFSDDADFTVTTTTTFKFELRGYCRIGNGASVSVWDIDEIRLFGCASGPDPCAGQGGDSDGDGVCDNQDCRPYDASLPTNPGTPCNDGNANTSNDVIQSDGCTCVGTPISAGLSLTCPDDITINVANGANGATVNWPAPTASSDCPYGSIGFGQSQGPPNGSFFPIGTTIIKLFAYDGCGNTAECSFTIKIIGGGCPDSDGDGVCNDQDNCPYDFNPSQQDSDGDGIGDACDTLDPCAGQGGDSDGDGVCDNQDCRPYDASLPTNPGTPCNDGNANTNNDVIQSDGCTCAGTPTSSGLSLSCPDDITVNAASGANGATVNWPAPTASSDCPYGSIGLGQSQGPPNGSFFPIGTTIIKLFAYDGCGNTAECSFTITVIGGGCPDSDGDGVCNNQDNCPYDFNPGQQDSDGDGIGDACDTVDPCAGQGGDSDGDGVCNNQDNCPYDFNPGQQDSDGDSIGDACDSPSQGLQLNCPSDITVNAPAGANGTSVSWTPPTASSDCPYGSIGIGQSQGPPNGGFFPIGTTIVKLFAYDGCGNTAECSFTVTVNGGGCPDNDGDGICNNQDNCPYDFNPGQQDSDGDGIGDACDTVDPCAGQGGDSDGDGVCNNQDNCPYDFNPGQEDSNGNGIGNACESCVDFDTDGICNEDDNCLFLWNPGQEDADNDGKGDRCDNCPFNFNPDQADSDGDGIGDVCDAVDPCEGQGGDTDGDGVCDNVDNCPNNFNPDQADSDGDGIGNTCDPIADCNSKVLVRWDMDNCRSFSSDGSNRDFSEFNPSFPNSGSCANITASRLSNEEGGHSCVAGASGSTAGICIEGEGGSSFRADDDDALRFSITVNPGNGKIGRLTELSFFQLSPFDFEHLSGNNGRNNYLRKFGVRILKNGNEVFRVTNKNTNQNDWELETFALTGSDFEYTNTTRFDFEILGYQPIRSGNPRFFDVDDIKIKGCCVNTWSAPAQEMAQFDAYKADRTVQLDWVTNTEYKNSHFVVERSSDGINFEDIEELASENNGSRMIRYEAVDTAPMLGDNYYRLKKVHHDLSFEYLPIRKVHFAIDVNEFAVFPNPARDALNVNLKDFVGQAASIQIFNSLGVLMSEKQFTQLEQEIEQFDVSKFHSGVYTISVQIADRKRISRLFIIAKP